MSFKNNQLTMIQDKQEFATLWEHLKTRTTYKISVVVLLVLAITLLHYLTRQDDAFLHVAYRELYFLPIILAGFWFGQKGGLSTALVITLFYAPMVLGYSNGFNNHDLGNLLEIILFNIIGILVGWLQDRELLRQKLKRQRDELAATGKAVACIAHDMKTPLVAIGGFTHQVRQTLSEEDKNYKKLDIVLQQTHHLETMITDMLDFSRPFDLKCQHNCFNTFFQDTMIVAEEKARKHRVRLCSQLQENAPICSFDYYRLQQALLNLINNAVEASPIDGKVIIRSQYNKDSFVIEVVDDGEGIHDEIINSILQPFFSNKKEGTGLGLPIVKKIAEAHGGELQYERQDSQGMIFRIVLPDVAVNQ
jgi:two-component system sensor histidine kinase HydH